MAAVRFPKPAGLSASAAAPTESRRLMAKRTLDRKKLRQDAEAAEKLEGAPEAAADAAAVPAKKPRKAKAPASPRPKRVSKKKEPVRMRARWGVFDGAMKQIAVFDYSERGAADQKLADLNLKKSGGYFLQLVKEPMPAPPPAAPPSA
jgi:hypothetical protein